MYYICKFEEAKGGLGIVKNDFYTSQGFENEIMFEGTFEECVYRKSEYKILSNI